MASREERLSDIEETARQINELIDDIPNLAQRLPGEDDFDLDLLIGALSAWSLILADKSVLMEYSHVSDGESADYWLQPEGLSALRFAVWAARDQLKSHQNLDQIDLCSKDLYTELIAARRRLNKFLVSGIRQDVTLETEWLKRIDLQIRRVRDLLEFMDLKAAAQKAVGEAKVAVEAAQGAAETASESASAASTAAGTAGDQSISKYFAELASSEAKAAGQFRVATIALMALGAGLVALLLFIAPPLASQESYLHLAQKLVATAAAFTLAAYLARQAHQHRTTANWAKAVSVQLKTFDAFVAPIRSDEIKEGLRATFASRVFGEPPQPKADSGESAASPLWDQMLKMLSRGDKPS